MKENGTSNDQPCNERVPDNVGPEVESSKIMHESGREEVQAGTYEPWTVVASRKYGIKRQGSGGAYNGMDNGCLKHELRKNGNEARFSNVVENFKASDGPAREFKRKLLPSKPNIEAPLSDAGPKVSSLDLHQAHVDLERSPTFHVAGMCKDGHLSKEDHRASIKGKKAFARARAHLVNPQTKAGSCQAPSPSIQSVSHLPQANRHQFDSTSKPIQGRNSLLLTTPLPKVSFEFQGNYGGEECEDGGSGIRGSSKLDGGVDGHMVCSDVTGESARELVGFISTACDVVLMEGADHGVAETEGMELEEGGHAFTSC